MALAWLLARRPRIVPILARPKVNLSDEDMTAIEARLAQIEVSGARLPPALLKVTNR